MHIIPKCYICHASHTSLVYMLKNIGLEGAPSSIEGACINCEVDCHYRTSRFNTI